MLFSPTPFLTCKSSECLILKGQKEGVQPLLHSLPTPLTQATHFSIIPKDRCYTYSFEKVFKVYSNQVILDIKC